MAMSTDERWAHFMHQRELQDKIKTLTEDLSIQGKLLSGLSAALVTDPASITFLNALDGLNAPGALSTAPTEIAGESVFEWAQLERASSLTLLVQTLQALRQAKQDLQSAQQALIRW